MKNFSKKYKLMHARRLKEEKNKLHPSYSIAKYILENDIDEVRFEFFHEFNYPVLHITTNRHWIYIDSSYKLNNVNCRYTEIQSVRKNGSMDTQVYVIGYETMDQILSKIEDKMGKTITDLSFGYIER
jgi:hypothetical protein